ncbi:hypothetical protein HanIR_Chr13g0662491 [Helianthus annuus]|nr:hypothetical protein HanIR_Chr13g0662491 [Helianthus annuus]
MFSRKKDRGFSSGGTLLRIYRHSPVFIGRLATTSECYRRSKRSERAQTTIFLFSGGLASVK